jgi:hypothetical protein
VSGAGGFTVDLEALRRHADHLRTEATHCAVAAAAGEEVRARPEDYGRIGAFVPQILDPLRTRTVLALRGCAEALGSAADRLDASAETYAAGEHHVGAAVSAIASRLGDGTGAADRTEGLS